MEGSAADMESNLRQGDQILTVNGENVRTATPEHTTALLRVRKNSPSFKGRIHVIYVNVLYKCSIYSFYKNNLCFIFEQNIFVIQPNSYFAVIDGQSGADRRSTQTNRQ